MNDVDVRQLLQDMLDHVPESGSAPHEIEAADERFLATTPETEECQLGASTAARHGWTPE
jgi:hypothetical protein